MGATSLVKVGVKEGAADASDTATIARLPAFLIRLDDSSKAVMAASYDETIVSATLSEILAIRGNQAVYEDLKELLEKVSR
jgi:hypothetical protein